MSVNESDTSDLDGFLEEEDTSDNFLGELMAEFGDGSKPAKKAKKALRITMNPVPVPPPPRWRPTAQVLRVIRQRCSCCGEEQSISEGLFLEENTPDSSALRYTPFVECARTDNLPRRIVYLDETTAQCKFCFQVDAIVAHLRSPQIEPQPEEQLQ